MRTNSRPPRRYPLPKLRDNCYSNPKNEKLCLAIRTIIRAHFAIACSYLNVPTTCKSGMANKHPYLSVASSVDANNLQHDPPIYLQIITIKYDALASSVVFVAQVVCVREASQPVAKWTISYGVGLWKFSLSHWRIYLTYSFDI